MDKEVFSAVLIVAVVSLLILTQISPTGLLLEGTKISPGVGISPVGIKPGIGVVPGDKVGVPPIKVEVPKDMKQPEIKLPKEGEKIGIGKLIKNKFRGAPQLGASFGKQKQEDERKRKEAEKSDEPDIDEEKEREKYDTPDIDEEEKSTTPKKKAKRCLCAGELVSKIRCASFGTPFADVCDPSKLDEDLGFCMSTPPCMKYCKRILKEKLLDPCVKKASSMGARCYVEGMRLQPKAECK